MHGQNAYELHMSIAPLGRLERLGVTLSTVGPYICTLVMAYETNLGYISSTTYTTATQFFSPARPLLLS